MCGLMLCQVLCGKWERFPREFAKCRRCRKAKYCGKECQSTAWSEGHRFWCSAKDPEEDGDHHHHHQAGESSRSNAAASGGAAVAGTGTPSRREARERDRERERQPRTGSTEQRQTQEVVGTRGGQVAAVRVAAPGGAATAVAATQTLRPQPEQAAGPVNPLAALGGGDNSIWTPRGRAGANPTPNHLRPSWARDPSPNVEPYVPQRMFARQLTTGPDARAEAVVGPSRDVDRPGTAAEDVDMAID